jgi:RNA polymerase sigma-70 factor (ECF subfamily)
MRGSVSESGTHASLLGRLVADPKDAAAWSEFVRRYSPNLLQWCRHWRLQESDAQDVTQDVLLRVARQMETFRYDPTRSFRGWLKAVTHNAWCDWLDAQSKPGRGSGDSRVLGQLATVEARQDLVTRLEEEFDRELLEAATVRVRLRVEPHVWDAFRLMTYEGLSGAETAERLKINIGAAFVAKSRVQAMLKAEIAALDPDGPP